jgi:membrane-associated phospholipid phosphatase
LIVLNVLFVYERLLSVDTSICTALLFRSIKYDEERTKTIINLMLMKQIIFFAAILLTTTHAIAQRTAAFQPGNYEAANWSTWLLDNPQQIMVAAPPGKAQAKAELQTIKQRMGKLDEKKLSAIKYWDAGAPAHRWNQIAPQLLAQKFDVVLRTPAAWVNLAIYNATVLAWREKIKYKRKRPHEVEPSIKPVVESPLTYSYPCEHSVTAAAAAHVLAYFFPAKADSIMQMAHAATQSRIDAGVQFPSDVDAGWKLGEQVAQQIIEQAKNDGSDKVWDGTMNKDPKKWTGKYPMGITLASFTPMIIHSADQFRPAAPPDFEHEMNELKNFKQTFKTRSLAYYWANNGPEFWNDLAAVKMFENRMANDAPTVARIYMVLNVAFHEMTIAIMEAKYTYWGVRPDQYDNTYKSLLSMPPFPGYPSGHAAGAGTTSAVLAYFFPADANEFRKLAKDCADSRFYAGIHFRTDNEVGLQMGEALGKYVVDEWMKNTTGNKGL